MPIAIIDGSMNFVRLSMTINEFPVYLARGIANAKTDTQTVEDEARYLVKNNFRDDLTEAFVRSVCLWGNRAAISGKVLMHNDLEEVSDTLRRALEQTKIGEVQCALRTIMSINGLGVSFASKHLKFLDPERHVILDSIISENLGYPRDDEGVGYAMFVSDCKEALKIVRENDTSYPESAPAKEWRISDIEMAIYQKIRDRN